MTKKRRVYRPRFVGGKIMMQADLERLQTVFTGIAAHVLFGANIADVEGIDEAAN